MQINQILIKPLMTEKAIQLAQSSVYMFEVAKGTNKHAVSNAIEQLYNVKVQEVRVIIRKGKTRKVGKRMVVKKLPDEKVAIVSLSKGSIDLFPKT